MMTEDIHDDDDDDNNENEDVILDRERLMQPIDRTNFAFNQFNIGIYDDSNKYAKGKTIILAVTCISIGMFTGIIGPTFPYLAEKMSTELSSTLWLIVVKGIGFLVGTCLSSYLYRWFNACCLLGLSCLSISFGVCLLPFISDIITFYLTAFILGIGFSLSYNGIDALYNHIWTRPSLSSIRWLHLLVALGAILSTLMLLPSTFVTETNTNLTQTIRPRRDSLTSHDSFSDIKLLNQATDLKSPCKIMFCCYYQNNRTNTFTCRSNRSRQSNDCSQILSSCQTSTLNQCTIEKSNIRCRIDQICDNQMKHNCSMESVDSISISTVSMESSSTTTKATTAAEHRRKPQTADSDKDDLSTNFFYRKIQSFLHSATWVDMFYLLISLSFFLLSVSYCLLAMSGEHMNLSSKNSLNPLSLLFIQPHRIINNPNRQISLLSDYSSMKFVFLLVLFYFILSGMESSCLYLLYIFGIKLKFTARKCLLFQFFYLFGRIMDILINYIWFLVNQYLKKETDFISIKLLIFSRLIALTIICFSSLLQPIFYVLFFAIGLLITSLSSLILYWIERDLSLNETLLRIILFTIVISECIIPFSFSYRIEYNLQFYLFVGLSSLVILFVLILYSSRKWQRNRFYRLLPTSMELGDIELEENSDNEIFDNTRSN